LAEHWDFSNTGIFYSKGVASAEFLALTGCCFQCDELVVSTGAELVNALNLTKIAVTCRIFVPNWLLIPM
jgi:uncharacterized membrane protein